MFDNYCVRKMGDKNLKKYAQLTMETNFSRTTPMFIMSCTLKAYNI
jgi:hypothetical protein